MIELVITRNYNWNLKGLKQVDKGCDFDFLKGESGSEVLRDLH